MLPIFFCLLFFINPIISSADDNNEELVKQAQMELAKGQISENLNDSNSKNRTFNGPQLTKRSQNYDDILQSEKNRWEEEYRKCYPNYDGNIIYTEIDLEQPTFNPEDDPNINEAPIFSRAMNDYMKQVNASSGQYKSTAMIVMSWFLPNGNVVHGKGSGYYVGGGNVSTAAHCVYNKSFGGFAKNVTVFFERNSASEFRLYAPSNNLSILSSYANDPKTFTDIAKIKFDFNWSSYNVPIRQFRDNFIPTMNSFATSLYGYPSESPFTGFTQYENYSNNVQYLNSSEQNSRFRSVNMQAKHGQSGGPLNYNGYVIGHLSSGDNWIDYYTPIPKPYADFLKQ